ncbi:MAG TPA: rhomboid family intramembrane serine protease [Polyangia bacterium]
MLVGVFVVDAVLRHPPFILAHLALHPHLALGREPWQLLTSALVHVQLGALASSAIAIWLFGSPVEEELGRGRLFAVLLVATLAGGVASALVALAITPSAVVTGADAAAMASIAAFGVAYGPRRLNLFGLVEMRGSTCAWLFLGLSAIFYLADADFVRLAGGVAGAGVGALVAEGVRLDRIRGLPARFRRWRVRRRYRVIPGGKDSRGYLN